MPEKQEQPDNQQHFIRQAAQQPEYDHAGTDGPDDLQDEKIIEGVEGNAQCYDKEFYKYQPEPSFDKKRTCFSRCFIARRQPGREARQEYESGRAEMRYPAGQVNRKAGGGRVQRVGERRRKVEKVAGMVQRHDDHHDTAEDIDGLYPVAAKGWHGCSSYWLCLKIMNAGK